MTVVSSYRLLIADDDDRFIQMLSLVLEDSGFIVEQASNCKEAIRLVKANSFDGLILDYHLPDGTGLDIYHEARKINKTLPVMMLSGCCDLEKITHTHGIQHVLHKPIRFEVMQKALLHMLA